MFEAYWGFRTSPFRSGANARWFHPSPAHEEALARLYFVIEQRRRFGLVSGPAGTGKSFLLDVLVRQIERTQRQVAVVDLLGLDANQTLWQLAEQLVPTPAASANVAALWRAIDDQVAACDRSRTGLVVVFDHLERAAGDCLPVLERLSHRSPHAGGWTTFIAATRNGSASQWTERLRELSDLCVELLPLDQSGTEAYILHRLHTAGCQRAVFDSEALDLIYDETSGQLRAVNRLCELSLLAAMSEGRDTVEAEVVRSAVSELHAPVRVVPVKAAVLPTANPAPARRVVGR